MSAEELARVKAAADRANARIQAMMERSVEGQLGYPPLGSRIIGRVLSNGVTLIPRDCQGPDESASDHDAEPRVIHAP